MTGKHMYVCFTKHARSTNVFEKEKRSCPFSSSKPRKNKGNKAFSVEAAADLASSDQGSFYNQEEWLQEIDKRDTSGQPSAEMSASRSKIRLDEVEDDQEDVGSWAEFREEDVSFIV